jgi:hypothetical protein
MPARVGVFIVKEVWGARNNNEVVPQINEKDLTIDGKTDGTNDETNDKR